LTRQRSSFRRGRVESPGDLEAMQDVLPSHQSDNDELIRLPEALEEMPEQQRRALLLREWQGLSYKEIADELGLSQAAVETLLFRARRSLASALTDEPKPKKAGVARKLRTGGDAGSLLALLKTLIFSGVREGGGNGGDGRCDLSGRGDALRSPHGRPGRCAESHAAREAARGRAEGRRAVGGRIIRPRSVVGRDVAALSRQGARSAQIPPDRSSGPAGVRRRKPGSPPPRRPRTTDDR